MTKINCDMGESFGIYQAGNDEEIMPLIDVANVACGFHASDPNHMRKTVELAKKHNVKKVVLTSSVAAIFDTTEKKTDFDESDWSDPDNPAISAYSKSKTLAEMAAWEFVKNEDHPFELAVINPALVVGASISGDIGESNKAVEMVASGRMPVAVPLMFGYVDVRDVAAAHILAMQTPASNGERFALVEKDLWYTDVAKLLRENGYDKAPKIGIPVWLAKILANFNKDLKLTLPYLGRKRSIKRNHKWPWLKRSIFLGFYIVGENCQNKKRC